MDQKQSSPDSTPPPENSEPEASDQLEQLPDDQPEVESSKPSQPQPDDSKKSKLKLDSAKGIFSKIRRFDLYLLGFVLLVIVGGIIVYLAIQHNNKINANNNAESQNLSQSTLNQLNNSDVQVGSTNQNLEIQSNTIFSGNVLVRNNLQVAGSLKLSGTLSLPTLDVSGTTGLNQLSVAGSANIAGALSVQKSLTVNSGGAFGGTLSAPTISVTTLQLNGDIQINHHIVTSGSLPRLSAISANLGSGGTVSNSGSDTAGAIAVHTGSGAQTGCVADLSFAQPYASTPHVVITAVGTNANSIGGYYIGSLSSTGFTVCVDQPQDSISFTFDYITVD